MIQIILYVEDDQSVNPNASASSLPPQIRPSSTSSESSQNKKLPVTLIDDQGYFLIGKSNDSCQTYVLTITIGFARNLLRVGSIFYFLKFLLH
jgi:hypothetical protein